jgi:hypothetical protein
MQKEKRKKNREKGTKKKERKKNRVKCTKKKERKNNREMHKETGIKRKKACTIKHLKAVISVFA